MKQRVLDLLHSSEKMSHWKNPTRTAPYGPEQTCQELQRLLIVLKKLHAPKKPLAGRVLVDTLGEAIAAGKDSMR